MQIKNGTQHINRGVYKGISSGSKDIRKRDKGSAPNTDTMIISKEARRAAMAAGMEKVGIDHGTVEKLISGKFNITEPDWEAFEAPTLQGQADRKVYNTAYFEAYGKELSALAERVQAHYAPELSKMESMNTEKALVYLFHTYKQPYMKDKFIEGTNIPLPPNGMPKEEADMAYSQLLSMHSGRGFSVLRDPYALGTDGIERLNNLEKQAHDAAQKVYNAAQKEYEAEQETWKAGQKEKYKRVYENINSGNSACLGYSALRTKTGTEERVN